MGRQRLMIWKRVPALRIASASAAGRCRRTRAATESGVLVDVYLGHGLALLGDVVVELARTGADRWGRRWRGNREGVGRVSKCSEWGGERGALGRTY